MARNDALRAEAKRLRTNVTKKVSRIKRNTGALVSGTSVDPRRADKPIAQMNAAELRAYNKGLSGFLDRKEQFVAGSRGTPIHRAKWNEYKRAEAIGNSNAMGFFNSMRNVVMPGGETVGEKRDKRRSEHRQMNPSVNGLVPIDRSPRSIEYEAKIDKLIFGAHKRQEEEYNKKFVDAGREQWRMMMDRIDETRKEWDVPKTQRARVEALSDEQFAALLLTEDFMEDSSLNYQQYAKLAGKTLSVWEIKMADEAMKDYDRLISWAENLKITPFIK